LILNETNCQERKRREETNIKLLSRYPTATITRTILMLFLKNVPCKTTNKESVLLLLVHHDHLDHAAAAAAAAAVNISKRSLRLPLLHFHHEQDIGQDIHAHHLFKRLLAYRANMKWSK